MDGTIEVGFLYSEKRKVEQLQGREMRKGEGRRRSCTDLGLRRVKAGGLYARMGRSVTAREGGSSEGVSSVISVISGEATCGGETSGVVGSISGEMSRVEVRFMPAGAPESAGT